jgi:hypothetical protein
MREATSSSRTFFHHSAAYSIVMVLRSRPDLRTALSDQIRSDQILIIGARVFPRTVRLLRSHALTESLTHPAWLSNTAVERILRAAV